VGSWGGKREGAGRKKGSLNKSTIARMSAAEVLGVEEGDLVAEVIHRRGHALLLEMERVVLDPTQPIGVRIMAAKTALPFLLPRRETAAGQDTLAPDLLEALEKGRARLHASRKIG
jgi:hypothetical protein